MAPHLKGGDRGAGLGALAQVIPPRTEGPSYKLCRNSWPWGVAPRERGASSRAGLNQNATPLVEEDRGGVRHGVRFTLRKQGAADTVAERPS